MILFQNVRKSYHSKLILDIPNFSLDKGIWWLKGPNGCGKTTLLKILAGIIPFEGDVEFEGISLKKKQLLYRQKIGWAEAEPLFPEFISGGELTDLYQSIRKTSTEQTKQLIARFQLQEAIDKPISTYSSGMQKKLAIILALIGHPALVIIDEPLITLDTETVDILVNLINEWHETRAVSFLLSSHVELPPTATRSHQQLLIKDRSIVKAL